MKKILLLLCVSALFAPSFSQNRKGSFRLDKESDRHTLYVSFYSDDFIHTKDINATARNVPGFSDLAEQYGVVLERGVAISEHKLEEFSATALKKRGTCAAISKLKKIFKVIISEPTNEILWELAGKLETLEAVEYASLVSMRPVKPPFDILPVTPDYEYLQTYLDPDPGVDMRYAWSLGLYGKEIRVRDVEYGVNVDHEVLNEKNIGVAPGMDISPDAPLDYTEHGTAVFGVVMADSAKYGNTGMAHEAAEMLLFPEWQSSGYDRILAVQKSLEASSESDVVIYEIQTGGYNSQYVPAEYNPVIWDLTKAATDANIIVVAAAGNGSQNLDDPFYEEYMNRGNSGAIIVGAGYPNTTHAPEWFTTYGSRVDVQGWGENVFTSGYGDKFQIGGDFNQYYTMFSGTSSATPIVASCVIVLQSYYYGLTGEYMTGEEMKTLLKETGKPQQSDLEKPIGPLPNMKAAIQALQHLEECPPPAELIVAINEDCLARITWNAPENVENPRYNVYKNDALILFETTELFYEEQLNYYEAADWRVETVCSNNNVSRPLTGKNEPCIQPCNPAKSLQYEMFTKENECYITLIWENGTPGHEVSYQIFLDGELLETTTDTTFTSVMAQNEYHEWCVQTLCGPEISDYVCEMTEPCTVGIETMNDDKMFDIFPNPAKDQITIQRCSKSTVPETIALFDMKGKCLYQTHFEGVEIIIPLKNISNGLYLLKITGKDRIFTKKIVKH